MEVEVKFFVLAAYVLVFALFGVAGTYFAKFLYFQWWRREMKPKYIVRALICILAVVVISTVLNVLGY